MTYIVRNIRSSPVPSAGQIYDVKQPRRSTTKRAEGGYQARAAPVFQSRVARLLRARPLALSHVAVLPSSPPSRSYEEMDSGQRSCTVKSLNADSGGKHASCSPPC